MTDPLINRDALKDALRDAATINRAADAVMHYLRDVLTPEALDQPREPDGMYKGDVIVTGTGMHRRIFGD